MLSDNYRNLTRRKYREVKDYYSWEDVCIDLASLMILNNNVNGAVLDQTSKLVGYIGYKTELVAAPIYWVDKELLTSLLRIDLPEDLINEDLTTIAPYIYFILPKDFIKDERGKDIKGIGVIFSSPNGETFTNKEGKKIYIASTSDNKSRLSLVGFSIDNLCYSISSPIPFTKKELDKQSNYTNDYKSLTAGVMSTEDNKLMGILTSLVINLLLIIKYKEELISEDKSNTLGFKVKDKITNSKFLSPKWIGKDFQVVKKHSSPKSDNSIRTRTLNPNNYPYWVKGHWRNVPIGKREEGKRIRKLIEPYIVLGPLKEE